MHITYTHSEKGIKAFCYFFLRKMPRGRVLHLLFFLMAPAVVGATMFSKTGGEGVSFYLGWLLFWILISVFLFPPLFVFQMVKNSLKVNGRDYLGTYEMDLDEKGVSVVVPKSTSQLQWDGLWGYAENTTHVFLFITPMQALPIPKADIKDLFEIRKTFEQNGLKKVY